MKKLFFQEKGSILIITLNVIIILSVFLFSFSFNSISRLRLVTGEVKRFQAYLNAKSGIVIALKELKEGKLTIPAEKTITLFGDEDYKAEISFEYASLEKKDDAFEVLPAVKGNVIRIISTGKYKDADCKITVIRKGSRKLLYYPQ